MANELVGAAIAYVPSQGRGPVSFVRNAAHVRPVDDRPEGLAHVGGQVDGDAVGHGGRGGEHDRPRVHLVLGAVLGVAHDDAVAAVHDLVDLGAQAHPLPEGDGDALGEGRRAPHDVAVQPLAGEEDEGEISEAAAGGDLVHVPGRAGHDGLEELRGARRQVTDIVGEGAHVLEVVGALLADRRGGAGMPAHQQVVAQHAQPDLGAGGDDRPPVAGRQREPEGVGRDVPRGQQRAVHPHALEGSGDPDGLDADLVQQGVGLAAGPGVDVRAPVHPVVAPTRGLDPAADPALGLQHSDVPVPQPPRRGQTGDPGTDDDDVLHGCCPLQGAAALGANDAGSPARPGPRRQVSRTLLPVE